MPYVPTRRDHGWCGRLEDLHSTVGLASGLAQHAPACDAILIDSTTPTPEEQVARIVTLAKVTRDRVG